MDSWFIQREGELATIRDGRRELQFSGSIAEALVSFAWYMAHAIELKVEIAKLKEALEKKQS